MAPHGPTPWTATAEARWLWHALEPIHAVTYFAPECHDRYRDLGLKGFWMGYFASRAAALGPVTPELATALFFNFRPSMVARALPDAWALAAPADVLAARREGSTAALARLLAPAEDHPTDLLVELDLAEAVALAEEAVAACELAGRPMFAALRADRAGGGQLSRLWAAATALREHRGDGHVAATVAAGLDGLDAHVTFAAAGPVPRDALQPHRGWTDAEWAAAEDRLWSRGWLDGAGVLTATGRAGRHAIETATDSLAATPWLALGPQRTARLLELVGPLAARIVARGGIPPVNPMGVPTG